MIVMTTWEKILAPSMRKRTLNQPVELEVLLLLKVHLLPEEEKRKKRRKKKPLPSDLL
jgi:hypothetical protein